MADIADEVVLPCFRISEALLSIVKCLNKPTKLVIVDRYFDFEVMKDAEIMSCHQKRDADKFGDP